jgi:hypothetical protein
MRWVEIKKSAIFWIIFMIILEVAIVLWPLKCAVFGDRYTVAWKALFGGDLVPGLIGLGSGIGFGVVGGLVGGVGFSVGASIVGSIGFGLGVGLFYSLGLSFVAGLIGGLGFGFGAGLGSFIGYYLGRY